jgi:ribosome maturation factor RimP
MRQFGLSRNETPVHLVISVAMVAGTQNVWMGDMGIDEQSTENAKGLGPVRTKGWTRQLRESIEEWADEAAAAHGLQYMDLDAETDQQWQLTVYLTRPSESDETGIDLDECADVSRYLEAYLDADRRVPENYCLNVSSFGLERELSKQKHLRYVVGKRIEVLIRKPIDHQYRITGRLLEFADDVAQLETEDGQTHDIAWKDIKEATLKTELDFRPGDA